MGEKLDAIGDEEGSVCPSVIAFRQDIGLALRGVFPIAHPQRSIARANSAIGKSVFIVDIVPSPAFGGIGHEVPFVTRAFGIYTLGEHFLGGLQYGGYSPCEIVGWVDREIC